MSSLSALISDRRAQLTTPRLVPALFVGVAVLAVVAAEVRDHVAAVDGPVDYCGLCHVNWTPIASLLIIAALVAIAAHTVSFVKWPPEGEDDE